MLVTVGACETYGIKDDAYENNAFEASKTKMVMRIVSTAPTIMVTVCAFQRSGLGVRGPYPGGKWGGARARRTGIIHRV